MEPRQPADGREHPPGVATPLANAVRVAARSPRHPPATPRRERCRQAAWEWRGSACHPARLTRPRSPPTTARQRRPSGARTFDLRANQSHQASAPPVVGPCRVGHPAAHRKAGPILGLVASIPWRGPFPEPCAKGTHETSPTQHEPFQGPTQPQLHMAPLPAAVRRRCIFASLRAPPKQRVRRPTASVHGVSIASPAARAAARAPALAPA